MQRLGGNQLPPIPSPVLEFSKYISTFPTVLFFFTGWNSFYSNAFPTFGNLPIFKRHEAALPSQSEVLLSALSTWLSDRGSWVSSLFEEAHLGSGRAKCHASLFPSASTSVLFYIFHMIKETHILPIIMCLHWIVRSLTAEFTCNFCQLQLTHSTEALWPPDNMQKWQWPIMGR